MLNLTLSTIKSIAWAILLSTLSVAKLPISILLRTKEGRSQNKADESLYSNTDVSVNVLQRTSDATLEQFLVVSANFCPIKPPKHKRRNKSDREST